MRIADHPTHPTSGARIGSPAPKLEKREDYSACAWFANAGGEYQAGSATVAAAMARAEELGHPSAAVLNIFLTMIHWQGGGAERRSAGRAVRVRRL